MNEYRAGQNSAIFYISRGTYTCRYPVGTIAYNSWVVGFIEELERAGVEPPTLICQSNVISRRRPPNSKPSAGLSLSAWK
jgi:hypothetical protein